MRRFDELLCAESLIPRPTGHRRRCGAKRSELGSFDDKEGKAENIHLHIGQRPILAAGNGDGDQAMLHYTTGSDGRRLGLIIDHDDTEREYDYRVTPLGHLETALAAAGANGWLVISMKQDWGRIFPGEVSCAQ